LRVGLSLAQYWMYETSSDGEPDFSRGLIPEFIQHLALSLGCAVSTVAVPMSRHVEKLRSGEIDIFGPMLTIPPGPSKTFFSVPINRLGLSAVMRSRPTPNLASVPAPTCFDDLKDPKYEIAVIKDSRPHLLANTRLNRPNERLVVCDSDEEALDRIMLRGVPKPAHVFICTTLGAHGWATKYPDGLQAVFDTQSTIVDVCDNAFAIRPDWPEVVPIVNQAISFLMNDGGFGPRIRDITQRHQPAMFDAPQSGTGHIQGMLGMVG
jgi:hypothetical protein